MLTLILLAASILPAQQTSMECRDTGATTAKTETQPVHGPGGTTAVLKVSTTDDHSKDSHECWAEYKLAFTPAEGAPIEADVDTSDGDWGRPISLRLAGFTRDGKRVLGTFTEGGKYATTLLFDYHAGQAVAQIVDLNAQLARVAPRSCASTLGIIGTTAGGAIVVESESQTACGTSRRWVIDPSGSKAHPLAQGAAIVALYEPNSGAR
jgi:hypothetical protein